MTFFTAKENPPSMDTESKDLMGLISLTCALIEKGP